MERYKTIRSQSWKLLHQKSSTTVLRTAYERKQQIHRPLTYLVLQIEMILELQILLHEMAECVYPSVSYQQRAGVSGVVYLSPVKLLNVQNQVIFNGP